MSNNNEWFEKIAARSGLPEDQVAAVLEAQRIPNRRVLPIRRHLHVNAVHFGGVKNIRSSGDETERSLEPFSFTHLFTQTVTAFATRARNDAGKSTILEVVLWAIRGTTSIAPDVRAWMRHAAVEIRVDDDRYLIAWTLNDKVPTGLLIRLGPQQVRWESLDEQVLADMIAVAANSPTSIAAFEAELSRLVEDGQVLTSFEGDVAFKRVIAEFMSAQLGFEKTEVWNKNRNASGGDDGKIVTHDWSLWSQALTISDKSITSTIGEDVAASQLVLQMLLGTAWGPAALAAKARKAALEAEIATLRRRRAGEDNQRADAMTALEEELATLQLELAELPDATDFSAIDELIGEVQVASSAFADAESEHTFAFALTSQLQRQLEIARVDEIALTEATITRRFWHSLKPSCCPRCDAVVNESRWAREQDGQCSLCDSDLEPDSTLTQVADETDPVSDDSQDELEIAHDRLITLELELGLAEDKLREAERERQAAATAQRVAREKFQQRRIDPGEARSISTQIAVLEGRILERSSITVRDEDLEKREHVVRVLAATETEAKLLSDAERKELLASVSDDITVLGRELGITQLDSATFRANCNLPVVKGGEPVNFGQLTEGEKLRLKIAVIISLLRVGAGAGVGRHPGLLVIDSLGREELNPIDVRSLLKELATVVEQTGLQVITSSASGDLLAEALPIGAVRLARESDDYMW